MSKALHSRARRFCFGVVMVLATASARAQPVTVLGSNFDAHKQLALAQVAQHIQVLQALQSCVQASSDQKWLCACRAEAQQQSGALR